MRDDTITAYLGKLAEMIAAAGRLLELAQTLQPMANRSIAPDVAAAAERPHRSWPFPVERQWAGNYAPSHALLSVVPGNRTGRPATTSPPVGVTRPSVGGPGSA